MKKFIALVSLFSLILVTPVHASAWDTMLKTINGALGFAISDDNTSRLVIDNTGKVGIGSSSPQATLDVAGNIRVGDTATNCDTNNEGSLRFNSTGNTMEFCNGLTWNKFVLNSNPIATNVGLSGTLTVEQTLTGSYTYFDEENDSEGATSFVWYRADDGLRTNEAVINGVTGTTYTLAMDDVGKFIRFEVTPRATTGALTGSPFSATTPSAITQDTTPDAFAFTDQTSVEPSTLTTSNSLTITGINGEVAVSVNGDGSPQIRIAGGSWTTSGTITNGQTLEVQLTSNAGYLTANTATITVGTTSDNWSVTTRPEDITPDAFTFTDLPAAERSTQYTSNSVTITGLSDTASVSVSGDGSPQIRIDGGSWTTSGIISNNQTLEVQLTSNASYQTAHSATVTVGTENDIWSVTTRAEDITPDSFSFTDQTNVELSTQTTSNSITITGLLDPASVSVSGNGSPQVSIAGGGWTTSGTITNGQSLQVRLTSSSSYTTAHTATINVGTGSDNWSVTTKSNFSASGGSITNSGGYTYHSFTSSGTFSVSGSTKNMEVLIVAGGGGGGWHHGGGGGGGGVVHDTSLSVSPGSYSINVGAGGTSPGPDNTKGNQGGDSTAFGLTASGGGGGGYVYDSTGGHPGGSGGGAGPDSGNSSSGGASDQTSHTNSSGTRTVYGNAGGSCSGHGSGTNGNGGGAGGAPGSSTAGSGIYISGFANFGVGGYFAGGGGGGNNGTGGSGQHGGGNGGNGGSHGYAGTANTGGGGGGGGGSNGDGRAGGSGIVLIRYAN